MRRLPPPPTGPWLATAYLAPTLTAPRPADPARTALGLGVVPRPTVPARGRARCLPVLGWPPLTSRRPPPHHVPPPPALGRARRGVSVRPTVSASTVRAPCASSSPPSAGPGWPPPTSRWPPPHHVPPTRRVVVPVVGCLRAPTVSAPAARAVCVVFPTVRRSRAGHRPPRADRRRTTSRRPGAWLCPPSAHRLRAWPAWPCATSRPPRLAVPARGRARRGGFPSIRRALLSGWAPCRVSPSWRAVGSAVSRACVSACCVVRRAPVQPVCLPYGWG